MRDFSTELIIGELFALGAITLLLSGYKTYKLIKNRYTPTVDTTQLAGLLQDFEKRISSLLASGASLPSSSSSTVTNETATSSESSSNKPTAESGAQVDPALNAKVHELLQEKVKLEARIKELESGAGKPTTESNASGNQTELSEKLKTLESQLEEYRILEDDIVNIKKYRQENAELKAQIESLKTSAASAVLATPKSSSDEPVQENPKETSAPITEPSEATVPATATTTTTEPPTTVTAVAPQQASASPEINNTQQTTNSSTPKTPDDDLLAEFEKILNV